VADAATADYRRASTLLDLSALTMWAGRESGMYMQHHAILVVAGEAAPQLFHWSYHRRQFVEGVLNQRTPGYGPALTCDPTRAFAGGLLFPRSGDSELVRFSPDEAYRIPKSYQSQWSGGGAIFACCDAATGIFPAQQGCGQPGIWFRRLGLRPVESGLVPQPA
jgi:hypothetical protein